MNILITGGAGFIGSHLAESLVERGYSVRVLDDLSTGTMENISSFASKVEFLQGSFADRELVRKALKGIDIVLHNAAFVGVRRTNEDPWRTLEVNNYFNHLFFEEVTRSNVSKLIFPSSSGVYGKVEQYPEREDQPINPDTPYALSKRLSEIYCRVLHDKFGIDACSFRYFNGYGPRQISSPYGYVISIFLKRALRGKPLIIFGDGTQTRDFTYISDIVDANLLAIEKGGRGEVFNIGYGKELSINELAVRVIKLVNKNLKIEYAEPMPGDDKRKLVDISKARKYLGFSPKVNIDEGLEKTLRWMSDRTAEK